MSSRNWIGFGVTLAVGTAVVIVSAFFAYRPMLAVVHSVYTPTTTIRLRNDTSETLTAASCGSDPATLKPGQVVGVDPNKHDPNAACVIYLGETRQVVGCLSIPTHRLASRSIVSMSRLRPDVLPSHCGD